jgi:hypothetical protein
LVATRTVYAIEAIVANCSSARRDQARSRRRRWREIDATSEQHPHTGSISSAFGNVLLLVRLSVDVESTLLRNATDVAIALMRQEIGAAIVPGWSECFGAAEGIGALASVQTGTFYARQ